MDMTVVAISFLMFALLALFIAPVIVLAHRYEMPLELLFAAVALPEGVVVLVLQHLFLQQLSSFETLFWLLGLGSIVWGTAMMIVALVRSRGKPLLRRRQTPLRPSIRWRSGP